METNNLVNNKQLKTGENMSKISKNEISKLLKQYNINEASKNDCLDGSIEVNIKFGEKTNFFKLAKESFQLIYKYSAKNKWLLIVAFLLTILITFSQIFGLFISGLGLQDILSNLVFDPGTRSTMRFVYLIIIFASMYLTSFLCQYLQSYLLVRTAQNIGYFIRYDLANKLQKLSISYLDTMSTGDLLSRFTNDVDAIVVTFSQSIGQVINAFFTIIGVIISIFLINPVLATISIVLIPILFVFILFFIRKSQPYFLKQQKILGDINSDTEEFISAHKMTSLFRFEKQVIDIFTIKNNDLKNVSTRAQAISGVIFPYNNFINNFTICIIACLQVILLIYAPNIVSITAISQLKYPAIVVSMFVMFLRNVTSQISTIFTLFNQFQLAFAALKRVNEILSQPNETVQNKNIRFKKPLIEFKNVSFGYTPNKMVLNNISFIAKPNSMNAIVGPTGSGKTTIISLLTRFYDTNQGQILIDGKDISQYSRKSIRKEIGIVLQDSYLFSDTIMENIRLARPGASDAEVIKAAKLANAHKFITQLPHGYETKVVNGEELISEGEKQLIAISRAFLSKAKIIILDEATSYVDTKTEKDIQIAMNKLMKSRTSFVIAHRLSTIRDADNIIVIKDGNLLESGNHKQLIKYNGFYAKMTKASNNDLDKVK